MFFVCSNYSSLNDDEFESILRGEKEYEEMVPEKETEEIM